MIRLLTLHESSQVVDIWMPILLQIMIVELLVDVLHDLSLLGILHESVVLRTFDRLVFVFDAFLWHEVSQLFFR